MELQSEYFRFQFVSHKGEMYFMLNYQLSTIVLLITAFFTLTPSVFAEKNQGAFSGRKSLGLIFLGGSILMVKQGIDFRNEADDLYSRYQAAELADEADKLYSRTNNRDIKSQVSLAVAGAFAISGFRFLFFSKDKSDSHLASSQLLYENSARNIYLESREIFGGVAISLRRNLF